LVNQLVDWIFGSLRLTSLTCPYTPAPGLALSPRCSLLYPSVCNAALADYFISNFTYTKL
ncbi:MULTISPECIES: hypothetical protein, partial [unclassified Lactonifactor]|uniref:hypothetical protein n=1 Tax=unclassified Lactonifactor TaxID=2636670 RepID=UPI0019D5C788